MHIQPQQRFRVEIVGDEEFPEVIAALWEAFENPFQGLLRIYFPILNNDRAASLKSCTQGQLLEYQQNRSQITWIRIVDSEANDRIAAAAKWYFFNEDPFAKEEGPLVADWYPEGIGRDFATMAARQFEHPREVMARRPQAFLHIAFTLPDYRGRGLGHLFMDWGLQKADELGLEAWLDASDFGVPLYERHKFRKVFYHELKPRPVENLSEGEQKEWAFYEKTLLPVNATVMWRPPYGKYTEGVTVKPWEVQNSAE